MYIGRQTEEPRELGFAKAVVMVRFSIWAALWGPAVNLQVGGVVSLTRLHPQNCSLRTFHLSSDLGEIKVYMENTIKRQRIIIRVITKNVISRY